MKIMSLPLLDDQGLPSPQGPIDIDKMVQLIQSFDDSMDQNGYTSSLPSPSLSSSSSTLSAFFSSNTQLNSSVIKQDDGVDIYKEYDLSMNVNSISQYSPGSTSSCPSPRTVYSNLSTPLTNSPVNINNNENLRDGERSVHFLNPFVSEFSKVMLDSSQQGLQNTPSATERQQEENEQNFQDYFPLQEESTRETIDSANNSKGTQKGLNTYTSKRPVLSKHVTFSDPSCVPQLGNLYNTKTSLQVYDENYWSQGHALASNQIKEFDLLILSLVAQGRVNAIPNRKRELSKTFEDIMPYLSGNSSYSQNVQGSSIHKRSKTGNPSWETESQSFPWLTDDGTMQHASWGSEAFRRQRSKTSSIVNALKDLPNMAIRPNVSDFKAETQAPKADLKGNDVIDPTGLRVTKCRFIEQAAKTALKGVKSLDEVEKRKRAIAGSKAREEQNREKSKRYYDRKKAQMLAMSGLCKAIKVWQSLFGSTMPVDPTLNFESNQAEYKSHKYNQKSLKEAQRIEEAFQIKTLMSCAEKLLELLKLQSSNSAAEIVLSHSNSLKNSSKTVHSQEYLILENGLHIWLDYLHCWADLVLAEKRLGKKSGNKPICELISSLTELL